MSTLTKIKVNNVHVGDRSISVDLSPLEGGGFPAYVKLDVTANIQGASLSSSGTAQASLQSVAVTVPFAGSSWTRGSSLNYEITAVYLSSDNANWEVFTGTLVDGSGTAVVS